MCILSELLVGLRQTDLWESWSTNAAMVPFTEEINQLHSVVLTARKGAKEKLLPEQAEALKGARGALLQKKGTFVESLTLFPLGQFVQFSCNASLEAHHRDIGFSTDLEACVQGCAALKTYSCDMLFKGDSLEIAVPMQAKVGEIQQKWTMIQQGSSEHFKKEHGRVLSLVGAKFEELRTALMEACILKYKKACLTDLHQKLAALRASQLKAEDAAALLEALTTAKGFSPVSQQVLTRCLGNEGKEISNMIMHAREFFGIFATALPLVVALIDDNRKNAPQLGSCRLVDKDLLKLMEVFEDEVLACSMSTVSAEVWLEINGVVDAVCKSAMPSGSIPFFCSCC